jgi:hypothetical protein
VPPNTKSILLSGFPTIGPHGYGKYRADYNAGFATYLINAVVGQTEFARKHLRQDLLSMRYTTKVNLDRTHPARPRESSDP